MTVISFADYRSAKPVVLPRWTGERATPYGARRAQWHKADLYLHFLLDLRQVSDYAKILSDRYGVEDGSAYKDLNDGWELLARIKAAQVALLLTPVCTQGHLEIKRRYAKHLEYLPVEAAAVAQALEADIAFLAIPKRDRRKAVQS